MRARCCSCAAAAAAATPAPACASGGAAHEPPNPSPAPPCTAAEPSAAGAQKPPCGAKAPPASGARRPAWAPPNPPAAGACSAPGCAARVLRVCGNPAFACKPWKPPVAAPTGALQGPSPGAPHSNPAEVDPSVGVGARAAPESVPPRPGGRAASSLRSARALALMSSERRRGALSRSTDCRTCKVIYFWKYGVRFGADESASGGKGHYIYSTI